MADVYRGYTMNEVGEAADWSSRERDLFRDIIDKLPEETDTLVTTEHTHCKLVASDGAPDPAAQVDVDGNLIVGSGIVAGDSLVHVYGGSAGAVAASAGTLATLENSDAGYLHLLVPDASTAGIRFGSPSKAISGYITYTHSTARLDFGADGIDIMRIYKAATSYMRMQNGCPIRGGGAAGLQLQNVDGNGCKVASNGDLVIDEDEFLQLGQAPTADTSGTERSIYGPSNLTNYLPIKDKNGTTYWVPCTSTNPS